MAGDDLVIRPTPTEEEAAAIAAAIMLSWPSPPSDEPATPDSTTWRFSGRWWHARPTWR